MLNKLFLVFFFSLFSIHSFSQKVYFNRVGEASNQENSYYYRVDKGGSNYQSFYKSNDAKFFVGKILNANSESEKNNLYSGKCSWYFKNGNLKKEAFYDDNGVLDGKTKEFFENGSISLEIEYKKGKILNNKYLEYDEKGKASSIFKEDFDNNNNDWDLYSSEKGVAQIVDGELILDSKTELGLARYIPFYSESKSYSIELKVDISEVSRGVKVGLIYGFKDWSNYNFYLISQNAFYVGSVYQGITSMKMDGMYSYDIKIQGSNVLKILSENGKSVFSVNGAVQYKGESPSLKGSNLGLVVGGKNKVKCDHIIFKELNGSINSALGAADDSFNASGSGFVFDSRGYVLTNHHVIQDASQIVVELTVNGEVKKFDAELIQSDETNDLALIRIIDMVPMDIKYAFKPAGSEEMGVEIFTLGYPLALNGMGKSVKFVDGKVSSKTGYEGAINSYQTSIPVQPGNSGGPVFNKNGEVIGIVNAKIKGADNVSYAVKINYAKNLIDLLPNGKYPSNGKLISNLSLEDKIQVLTDYVVLIKIK